MSNEYTSCLSEILIFFIDFLFDSNKNNYRQVRRFLYPGEINRFNLNCFSLNRRSLNRCSLNRRSQPSLLCSDQEEINSDDTDYEKQTTTSSNRKAKKLSSAMPVKDKFILLKDNLYKCKLCGEVSIVYDKHQNNSFIFNFFESR